MKDQIESTPSGGNVFRDLGFADPEAELADPEAELAAADARIVREDAEVAATADDGWEWMIVEVMGHRRHAGRVREIERFGAKFMRVDVPNKGDPETHGWTSHFYPPSSLFGFTPAEKAACLKANKPYEPAARLSLPRRDEDQDREDDDDMPF